MNTTSNTISVTYSDSKLRILVEEYITMQKHDFTFKSLCSYVLYRAMEEEKTANTGLYESNQLSPADCERISDILRKIIKEGRLTSNAASFADNTLFVKNKE
jgi:hypothetical protein